MQGQGILEIILSPTAEVPRSCMPVNHQEQLWQIKVSKACSRQKPAVCQVSLNVSDSWGQCEKAMAPHAPCNNGSSLGG